VAFGNILLCSQTSTHTTDITLEGKHSNEQAQLKKKSYSQY